MIININEFVTDIERKWEEPVEPINEMFSQEPHNFLKLVPPFNVDMRLVKIGNDIDVKGKLDVTLSFRCARCGEDASSIIEESFHYVLIHKEEGETEGSEEEKEEETELSYYSGEEIELSTYAREQLILAIPIKLLCSEDCKGICGGCGANLNTEKCRCKKGNGKKSPFEILKTKK